MKNMKTHYLPNMSKLLLLLLFILSAGLVKVAAQSGSFGNTYIGSNGNGSNGETAIINAQHSFLNGGVGVKPGIVSTLRTAPKGYLT